MAQKLSCDLIVGARLVPRNSLKQKLLTIQTNTFRNQSLGHATTRASKRHLSIRIDSIRAQR
eukprot:SAG31_NODE_3745_length_3929_cov_2.044125_4_plen_62_part_00